MTKHTQKRIATAEVTNMINTITKEHGVELAIETTYNDEGILVKAWKPSCGNRQLVAFVRRKCLGDALNELEKELRK